ncbi:MAG: formylglycine-generating enzyme family protein [Elusimicrobia bacterium]|nr:formylglycine-generating enzyme family protein [Elusimicrobiota bacterium]
MVLIPAGPFFMGAPDQDHDAKDHEWPYHEVYLSSYYIDKYEVTAEQFCKFLSARGTYSDAQGHLFFREKNLDGNRAGPCLKNASGKWEPAQDRAKHPAANITRYGAQAYCQWEGRRLPTEAEWEKAARGGMPTRWHFGDDIQLLPDYAWHTAYSGSDTHPAGLKKPNQFGLYDMIGNAGEFVSDRYGFDYYSVSPKRDPQGPDKGDSIVLRGCSDYGTMLATTRSSARVEMPQSHSGPLTGFRCAVSSSDPKAQ